MNEKAFGVVSWSVVTVHVDEVVFHTDTVVVNGVFHVELLTSLIAIVSQGINQDTVVHDHTQLFAIAVQFVQHIAVRGQSNQDSVTALDVIVVHVDTLV